VKSNREIRRTAWTILRTRWFWRLLTVGLVLNLITQIVNRFLTVMFQQMNIQTWTDFLTAKFRHQQAGLDFAVSSLASAGQMTVASLFEYFIVYIFGAIVAFGIAGATLKAAKNDEHRWFNDSFGGFQRPFEVTWLMAVMNLRIALWSLLFLIPGLVAVYRYRQAWYLKSEHPDWTAAQCLDESSRMMKGYKAAAFSLDLSFFGWFLLAGLAFVPALSLGALTEGSVLMTALGAMAGLVAVYFLLFVLCYFLVARTVFYRELAASDPS